MIITYSTEQSAAIVAKWNEHANDENQLTADQAHLVFHDNSDADMTDQGYTQIEVGSFRSRTGNPATFIVEDSEVTLIKNDEGQ